MSRQVRPRGRAAPQLAGRGDTSARDNRSWGDWDVVARCHAVGPGLPRLPTARECDCQCDEADRPSLVASLKKLRGEMGGTRGCCPARWSAPRDRCRELRRRRRRCVGTSRGFMSVSRPLALRLAKMAMATDHIDARAFLVSLVGETVYTVDRGDWNRVLGLEQRDGCHPAVPTRRCGARRACPGRRGRARGDGRDPGNSEALGHRSSFVGAVLAHHPRAVGLVGPSRVRLRGAVSLRPLLERALRLVRQPRSGPYVDREDPLFRVMDPRPARRGGRDGGRGALIQDTRKRGARQLGNALGLSV